MQILECFTDQEKEWTLKELVNRLGLPTTTVFRHVSTLMERKYLTQDPVRKSYHVGPNLLALAGAIIGGSDLRKIARPELERLSDRVKETINLSILVDTEIFYLDKVETQRSITCNTRVGGRVAAHATSCGKILLADRDADFLAQYCEWMKSVPPLTPKTITQPDRLLKELESARINGYATDDGEVEQGLICVAAPVRDAGGHVIAAVSIAGPDYRMEQDMEMMIREIRQAAERISYAHGFFQRAYQALAAGFFNAVFMNFDNIIIFIDCNHSELQHISQSTTVIF